MNIYLIRHGEQKHSPYYDPGAELTPLGLKQSNLLGWRLQSACIFRIYTSDQAAASQTAEAINRHLHREVIVLPQFREVDLILSVNQAGSRDMILGSGILESAGLPGTGLAVQIGEIGRGDISAAYSSIVEIAGVGLDAVVISHAGTILSLVCRLLGFNQEKSGQISLPDYCSICKVNYSPQRGFTILSINDTSHLA
jgi:broad specificity phosphatase PhoE